jgi:hypothetical protein
VEEMLRPETISTQCYGVVERFPSARIELTV